MSGWQPIETAPKDGRTIIVHSVVRFRNSDVVKTSIALAQWDGKAFSFDVMGDGRFVMVFNEADLWMPLPEPPK